MQNKRKFSVYDGPEITDAATFSMRPVHCFLAARQILDQSSGNYGRCNVFAVTGALFP